MPAEFLRRRDMEPGHPRVVPLGILFAGEEVFLPRGFLVPFGHVLRQRHLLLDHRQNPQKGPDCLRGVRRPFRLDRRLRRAEIHPSL